MRIKSAALAIGAFLLSTTAAYAGQTSRTTEQFHILDYTTSAPRDALIAAAESAMAPYASGLQTNRPVVVDQPPAEAARFRIVDPLANSQLGALAAMSGAAAQLKIAKCDGAVWTATLQRMIGGKQELRLYACIFPRKGGYALDIYAIDSAMGGGSLSMMLGRAIESAALGKPEEWTQHVIVSLAQGVSHAAGVEPVYVDGEPKIAGLGVDPSAAGQAPATSSSTTGAGH